MDIVFTCGKVLLVVLAIFMRSQATAGGKSTWFEGVLLLAVYASALPRCIAFREARCAQVAVPRPVH
jgi:Ca2+/H+ antiporter